MTQISQPRKKILCIEDDRDTAALIAEELVERGYEVQLARDGQEGLAAILRTMPDLVLSDISMPVMSGFELLERLTALAPRFGTMPDPALVRADLARAMDGTLPLTDKLAAKERSYARSAPGR